jgi:hypothetical protein
MSNDTQTLTLTEFLLARIAEDEAAARDDGADAMMGHRWKHAPENVYQELQAVVLANSRRVLAECEAKRLVVKGFEPYGELDDMFAPEILAILAAVYADHPDYRDEWKP